MMFPRRLVALAAFLALLAQTAIAREWTDATGKFKTEAELVKVDNGVVFLKKQSDGATIQVPIARLSGPDQAYLQSLESPAPELAAVDNERPLPLHTAGCIGLLVVDPKPLLQQEALSTPPLKDLIEKGVAAAGIDFRRLDRITVFSLKPKMPVDPASQEANAVAIAEFSDAVDTAPMLEKIPMKFEATTVAGKACHKPATTPGPWVCAIDEKTLAFAADEKSLSTVLSATNDNADLARLLKTADAKNEIRYAVTMAPMKDLLTQVRAAVPPDAAKAIEAVEKIDSLVFTTDLDGPPSIELLLHVADTSSAAEVEKAIRDGLAKLPDLMKAASAAAPQQGPQPGAPQMNPAMMAQMLGGMADKIDEFLTFEQQEAALKVSVKFPPDSPPLADKLVQTAGFLAMMSQASGSGGPVGPPK